MSVRKERFCDFMIEEKPDYMGHVPKPTKQCTNSATGTCFFCKRDYCTDHRDYSDEVKLKLEGFKQDFSKVLPCCKECRGRRPYNPDPVVLKYFDKCWFAIRKNIRAEIKSARATAEAAREKRRATAAAKLEPKAEVAEAVVEAEDAKPEVNKEMAPIEDQIDEIFSSLSPREQRVLQLRFGLEDGQSRTLEEVGKEVKVTRERIRQIEAKALRKLRHPSRSRHLKDYLDEEKPHDLYTPVDKLLRAIFGE